MKFESKGFNLFRVNCLLNDVKSTNFNSIILSIIQEYFYESKNAQAKVSDLYSYIREYLKIVIDYDFLQILITKSEKFELEPINDDSYVKVKAETFKEIERTIASHSIDTYIVKFLETQQLDLKHKEKIEALLYAAVFENINSFSVDNLSTLLPMNENEEFSKEDIELYNSFLDEEDESKNKAIYNVLSRAVEFAILTSGKGIQEISKELFKDKTFILDTNIIFRLLGVGGVERADSVYELILKCKKIGINFQYTGKTHIELSNKLDQIINFLNSSNVLPNIEVLGEMSESHPELFRDDFIVHYSLMKRKGIVNTPEQYQRKLYGDYQKLLTNLGISIFPENKNIDMGEIAKLAKIYFSKKRAMGIPYGKKASEVDAYNITVVRQRRGANNHNFSDVKSFYLTSDRSLNRIVSEESDVKIPETILPSQLYILCNPYFDFDGNEDYEEFIKFIKRRKTDFKYAGTQVLNYIKSIRELTTDVQVISESLILYSDIKFRKTKGSEAYTAEAIIPDYRTVLQTVLDKKLVRGDETERVFASLKIQTEVFVSKKFSLARKIARVLDILLTILIVPIGLLLTKAFTKNLAIQVGCTAILEAVKFYLSSRYGIFEKISYSLFRYFSKEKRAELLPIHTELVEIIDKKSNDAKNKIW